MKNLIKYKSASKANVDPSGVLDLQKTLRIVDISFSAWNTVVYSLMSFVWCKIVSISLSSRSGLVSTNVMILLSGLSKLK